jgi:hypothetical protein
MRGLAQQSKRVDTLMTRLLVEGMRKDLPDLSLQAKRKLPALSQRFVEKLNSKIHESTKQIRLAAAPAESPKGLRKLARSSAKK